MNNGSQGNFCQTVKLYCFSKLNAKVRTFFKMPFSEHHLISKKMTVCVVSNGATHLILRSVNNVLAGLCL